MRSLGTLRCPPSFTRSTAPYSTHKPTVPAVEKISDPLEAQREEIKYLKLALNPAFTTLAEFDRSDQCGALDFFSYLAVLLVHSSTD